MMLSTSDDGIPDVPSNKIPATSTVPAQSGQVINYYFPVEVDVLGALDEIEVQRIARYVYDELITALQSQAPRVE